MTSIIVECMRVILQLTEIMFMSCIKTVFCFLPNVCAVKDIRNDVVLITGGGRGIGRLIALEFAKHRPKQIILWGRNEETLQATTSAVTSYNVPCAYMVCDVGNDKQVVQQADRLRSQFGDVSIVVNNAGIVCSKLVNDMSMGEMENVIQVNTLGQIRVTKAFLPAMMSMNHGHVVSVNSMMGLMALAGAADYTMSKFALTGFMDSLRAELAETNIKVTSVHPYLIDTGMFTGFAPRFPRMIPALSAQYVAEKTVQAVLTDQTETLLPRSMYLIMFIKSVLPTEAQLIVHKFLGLNSAMDGFRRQQSS